MSASLRKSPSQARSRATIEAVLAAAAHILESGGLAAFNTNAVADRAGVSIGSLYQYFPNKDAILAALIEKSARAAAESLEGTVDNLGEATLEAALSQLIAHGLALRDRSPGLTRILDAEEDRLRPFLDIGLAEQSMAALVQRVISERRTIADQAELDGITLRVILIGRALMGVESADEAPNRTDVIARTVGAIMGYLAVAAPE